MNYRYIAAAISALMLLSPLAAAGHESEPPAGTIKFLGGASVYATVNMEPQELTWTQGNPNVGVQDDLPGEQVLKSPQTYDCATGALDPAGSHYFLDAVTLLYAVPGIVGINDHDISEAPNLTNNQSNYRYGADLLVGFGNEKPANLLPGMVTFYAYVLCGGEIAKVLPQAVGDQLAGLYAAHDENVWGPIAGSSSDFTMEFDFTYYDADPAQAGAVLPGEIYLTPGWYMNALLTCCITPTQTNTFRFVVNPIPSGNYPGYLGSKYAGYQRECVVNKDAGAQGGVFGNCDNGGAVFISHFFYPEGTPVDAELAPPLEDIDVYTVADATLLGGGQSGVIEPAWLEANAAVDHLFWETAWPGLFTPQEIEPTVPGEDNVKAIAAGWSLYLDVHKYTNGIRLDPLYGLGITDQRDHYPGYMRFNAYFGLARDTNGNGLIGLTSPEEFFPIADYLRNESARITNWGDVGFIGNANESGVGGNDFIGGEQFITLDGCGLATSTPLVHGPGEAGPIGSVKVTCNAANGDVNATGWGTFTGPTSTGSSGASARYSGANYIVSATGSLNFEASSVVKARVIWPSFEDWKASGLALPAGLDTVGTYEALLAGKTMYVQDIDFFGPTLG